MSYKKYKYIYGPVSSWRLGSSLGIDPISREDKLCTFDCVYCQLGETGAFSDKREIFVSAEELMGELRRLPPLKMNYLTFSGRGEPTLAANLGEMIAKVKGIRKEKVAVITNSSLIDRDDVRKDLALADLVMAKLDACSEKTFLEVNKPVRGVTLAGVLDGLKRFREDYKGRFALQIMCIGKNRDCLRDLAGLAEGLKVDEVQINTPLRPCKEKPLPKEDLDIIVDYFKGMKAVSVYEREKKAVKSVSEAGTLKRRGKEV